jgi:FtsP/CotA-like multicopper oxidase with cupredoxin domain
VEVRHQRVFAYSSGTLPSCHNAEHEDMGVMANFEIT